MRKLDNKFSIENNYIVKTSNGEAIPDDEPLFLIRARDRLALATLLFYQKISKHDGCNDYHMESLQKTILEFEQFFYRNPKRMKQPSITRGL